MKENKKSSMVMAIVAAVLIVVSVLLAGIGGLANFIPGGSGYGVRVSINYYLAGFAGNFSSKWSFVVLVIDAIILLASIATLIDLLRKHKAKYILFTAPEAVGLAFLPYLVILGYGIMSHNAWTSVGIIVIVLCFVLDIVGIFLMLRVFFSKVATDVKPTLAPAHEESLSEDQIRVIVRDEIEKYEAEKETPTTVAEPVETLTKEDVQKIVDEAIAKALEEHVDEKHAEPVAVAAPVEEKKEEPVEEVKEEPAPVEEEAESEEEVPEDDATEENVIEEGGANDPFAALRNKRRASFETRVKNSEYDIRHKYYDLRDYIKDYGLSNRISIPGDTFSAHRKRYVFITISGKHIKVYFAANPDDYKDTPIPVEHHTTKKYEDLPLLFNIRSDLSFRRALKLVDDMLTKEGFTREDKPIKNTQNPEEK